MHPNLLLLLQRAPDITAIVVLAVVSSFTRVFPQFDRLFSLDDPDISLIHVDKDIVSSSTLAIVSVVFPALFMILFISLWKLLNRKAKVMWTLYAFACGLAVTLLINKIVTNILKTQVGRLRPDFLARCQPIVTNSTVSFVSNSLVFYDERVCTGIPSVINEGRVSFPSGHSSTAFAGLGFLALTLITLLSPNINLSRAYQISIGNSARIITSALLFLGASYIAVSRVQQNVHNPTDVIAGSLLGFSIALLVWWFYIGSVIQSHIAVKLLKNTESILLKRFDRLDLLVLKESSVDSPMSPKSEEDVQLIVMK